MNVGDTVRVLPGWWANRGMNPTATIHAINNDDRMFTYAISVGDGRAWAMATHELEPLS